MKARMLPQKAYRMRTITIRLVLIVPGTHHFEKENQREHSKDYPEEKTPGDARDTGKKSKRNNIRKKDQHKINPENQ
jgi:hypothetical protein